MLRFKCWLFPSTEYLTPLVIFSPSRRASVPPDPEHVALTNIPAYGTSESENGLLLHLRVVVSQQQNRLSCCSPCKHAQPIHFFFLYIYKKNLSYTNTMYKLKRFFFVAKCLCFGTNFPLFGLHDKIQQKSLHAKCIYIFSKKQCFFISVILWKNNYIPFLKNIEDNEIKK